MYNQLGLVPEQKINLPLIPGLTLGSHHYFVNTVFILWKYCDLSEEILVDFLIRSTEHCIQIADSYLQLKNFPNSQSVGIKLLTRSLVETHRFPIIFSTELFNFLRIVLVSRWVRILAKQCSQWFSVEFTN
jgi:hypothetical protein